MASQKTLVSKFVDSKVLAVVLEYRRKGKGGGFAEYCCSVYLLTSVGCLRFAAEMIW